MIHIDYSAEAWYSVSIYLANKPHVHLVWLYRNHLTFFTTPIRYVRDKYSAATTQNGAEAIAIYTLPIRFKK